MVTTEYDYLGRRLAFAHKAMRAELEARLVEAGGSFSTWLVLRSADGDSPLSQRELADALGVEAPTLVRHLDRLAVEGLIERQRDPDDRRVTRVAVTPRGVALLDRLVAVAEGAEAELSHLLGRDEHRRMRKSLQVMHDYFSSLAEERKTDANRHR